MTDQELADARAHLHALESERIAAENNWQDVTRMWLDQYMRVTVAERDRALRFAVRDLLADRIAAERRGQEVA